MKTRWKWMAVLAVAICCLMFLIWPRLHNKGAQTANIKIATIGSSMVKPRMLAAWGRIIIVASDGTLWGWGDSAQGELGVVSNGLCGPRQISAEHCWKEVASACASMIALKMDGTLWMWGRGSFAANRSSDPCKPRQFGQDTNWIHLAAGSSFYLAQKLDGTLWTWGRNNEGQLGDGSMTDSRDPIQIGSGPWRMFAAGSFHAMAIAPDGTLWGWGRHAASTGTAVARLGDETNWVAVYAGEFHNVARKRDGSWWVWGDNAALMTTNTVFSSPARIAGRHAWSSVAGGNTHTIALGEDGSLWGLGHNGYGEIGDGTRLVQQTPVRVGLGTNWIAVAATGNSSAGMTADGRVFVWGSRVDVPAHTENNAIIMIRRILSSVAHGAKGSMTPAASKIYANSARPIAIMQFQRAEFQSTNVPAARPASPAVSPSTEH